MSQNNSNDSPSIINLQEEEVAKENFEYPNAGKSNAAREVQEAVQRFREEVSESTKRETPLIYWLLGTGTPEYKMSKEDAGYKQEPEGTMVCSNCQYWYVGSDGEGVCSKVRGQVWESHWCRLWAPDDMTAPNEKSSPTVVDFDKERVYVDSPADVPEEYDVQEGTAGGVYYETDNQTDSSDVAPQDMINIDATDIEPDDFINVGGNEGFVSSVDMNNGWIDITFADGSTATVKQGEQVAIDDDRDVSEIETVFEREAVDRIEFSDFGSALYTEEKAREDAVSFFNGMKNKDIVNRISQEVDIFDDADASVYRSTENAIQLSDNSPDGVLTHEMAHAIADIYGFDTPDAGTVVANVFTRDMSTIEIGANIKDWVNNQLDKKKSGASPSLHSQIDAMRVKVDQIFDDDEVFEESDFKFNEPDDDAPEEIKTLVQASNDTWERQIEATDDPDEINDEYHLGRDYSATHAHETLAVAFELLKGGRLDEQGIENLWTKHPDMLEAFIGVIEPSEGARVLLNEAFESFGPNEVFDEMPYPEDN
jgi:hypothetical protein